MWGGGCEFGGTGGSARVRKDEGEEVLHKKQARNGDVIGLRPEAVHGE